MAGKISEMTLSATPAGTAQIETVADGVNNRTPLSGLPISTAAQSALDAKLPIVNPTSSGDFAHTGSFSVIGNTQTLGLQIGLTLSEILPASVGGVQVTIPDTSGTLALQSDVTTHAALTTAHGATDANTASRIVMRNAGGTFTVSGVQLDTSATPTQAAGLVSWDAAEETAQVGVNASEAISLGAELSPRYRNASGSTMTSGTAAYITGATGSNTNIGRAKADALATCRTTIGIVTTDAGITNNGFGRVCTYGVSHNHDTSAFTAGDILWVSPTTAGALTNVEPTTEGHFKAKIGSVQRSHASLGEIFVDPEFFGSVTGDAVASAVSKSAARNAIDALPVANPSSTGALTSAGTITSTAGDIRADNGGVYAASFQTTGTLDFEDAGGSFFTTVAPSTITENVTITLPAVSGTVALAADVALKAPIASPTFTGPVTAPAYVLNGAAGTGVTLSGGGTITGDTGSITVAAGGTGNRNITLLPLGATGRVTVGAGTDGDTFLFGALISKTVSGGSGHTVEVAGQLTGSGGYSHALVAAEGTYDGVSWGHLIGFQSKAFINITGTMDFHAAFNSQLTIQGTATVTELYGLMLSTPNKDVGATIGRYRGVYIAAATSATTNWAVYSEGASTPSYHAGVQRFGSTVSVGVTDSETLPTGVKCWLKAGTVTGAAAADTSNDVLVIDHSVASAINFRNDVEDSGSIFFSDTTRAVGRVTYSHATDALTIHTNSTLRFTLNGSGLTLTVPVIAPYYVGSTQALSGAGAANVTTATTKITSTGALDAITLADGVDGQVKKIIHDVAGGSFVLTPTTRNGWASFTSTAAGESITLEFVTTRGWTVMSNRLGTIA